MDTFLSRTCLVLVSLPMLSGCIGFSVVYPKDSIPTERPHIGDEKGSYSPAFVGTKDEKKSYTCSELEARWGEPDLRTTDGKKTTLIYKVNGRIWAGILPMVGIVIPLVVPVSRKQSTFVCEDNVLITASETVSSMAGGYCVVYFGCYRNGEFGNW